MYILESATTCTDDGSIIFLNTYKSKSLKKLVNYANNCLMSEMREVCNNDEKLMQQFMDMKEVQFLAEDYWEGYLYYPTDDSVLSYRIISTDGIRPVPSE